MYHVCIPRMYINFDNCRVEGNKIRINIKYYYVPCSSLLNMCVCLVYLI